MVCTRRMFSPSVVLFSLNKAWNALTHNDISHHTYWTRTHLKKHHHLETIYWTFATRYQLNTELSILSLHPPTAGTGSTSLHWEEGMLQDLVRRTLCWKSFGFLSFDNKEKWNLGLPFKCPTLLPLLAARSCAYRPWQKKKKEKKKTTQKRNREKKKSIYDWDTPLWNAVWDV